MAKFCYYVFFFLILAANMLFVAFVSNRFSLPALIPSRLPAKSCVPSAVLYAFTCCVGAFQLIMTRVSCARERMGTVGTRFECGEDDMLTAQMNHFSHVNFPSPLLILLLECIQYRRILRTYRVANCHADITQIQHIQFSLLFCFFFFFLLYLSLP